MKNRLRSTVARLRSGKSMHRKEEIQELADELNSSVVALDQMGKLSEIDSQKTIVDIVDRLPRYVQIKWKKEALSVKRDTGVYPGIKRLQTFITSVAEDVNDPVYGYQEDWTKKSASVKPAKSHHSRSFNVTTVPGSNPSSNPK